MRAFTTKKVLKNSHSLRGIMLLTVLFILAFLSNGCEKESQKTDEDQQTLSPHTDTSLESPLEKRIIIVHLPGLPEDAKKLEMVLIQPGSFTMGSSMEEQGRLDTDWPLNEVTITKPFYMGKYEVTQAQWESVMGNNPSYFRGKPNNPVEKVRWRTCQRFIKKLNSLGQVLNSCPATKGAYPLGIPADLFPPSRLQIRQSRLGFRLRSPLLRRGTRPAPPSNGFLNTQPNLS